MLTLLTEYLRRSNPSAAIRYESRTFCNVMINIGWRASRHPAL